MSKSPKNTKLEVRKTNEKPEFRQIFAYYKEMFSKLLGDKISHMSPFRAILYGPYRFIRFERTFFGSYELKLYKLDKKIIAFGGFDDYYNKFGYKDLYKKLPKLKLKLKRGIKNAFYGISEQCKVD